MTKIEQAFHQRQSELLPEGKLQWQYADTRKAPVVLSEPPAPSIHVTRRQAELQRKFGMDGLHIEGRAKRQDKTSEDMKFRAVATTYKNKPVKVYYTVSR